MFRFLVALGLIAAVSSPVLVRAEEEADSPRALFEAGKYQETVDVVRGMGEGASPPDLYIAAQGLVRLDRFDEARDMFRRLDNGDEGYDWTFISRSAMATLDGDMDAALDAANRAAELAPEDFYAHYQLGIVKIRREDFNGAAAALDRATQLDGNDAYAHYYAGIAFNKARRVDKMAQHFKAFTTLAPHAPERPQVETIMRTLRK